MELFLGTGGGTEHHEGKGGDHVGAQGVYLRVGAAGGDQVH